MEKIVINPWTWQDEFGDVQANDVSDGDRVLYCAGQTSVDAEGKPVHEGDLEAQVLQALDNIETVLAEGLRSRGRGAPQYLYDRRRRLLRGRWHPKRSARRGRLPLRGHPARRHTPRFPAAARGACGYRGAVGNITRRVDFALFMAEALENDDLVREAPAIVGCQSPSALAHTAA